MDDVIRSVELDKKGYREVAGLGVQVAERRIAPGIVKKMVIHVLYKIMDLVRRRKVRKLESWTKSNALD